MEYTKDRNTNAMRLPTSGNGHAFYYYIKPTVRNCRCTTTPAGITRKEKIQQCKALGLI